MSDVLLHIIEDDAPLRNALLRLFRSAGMEARSHGSVQAFLDQDRPDRPGCLILDVQLPDMNGMELHARLRSLSICMPAVIITGHGDIAMSVRAMKAGAVDFLPKPFQESALIDAVEAAVALDRARREATASAAEMRRRYASLTARERSVMALVAAGRLNKQVAWELGISEVTVKIYRRAAMQKMGAVSLAELVRTADLVGKDHV